MKYYYEGEWKELNVKVYDSLPIGTIMPYANANDSIPSGWLECNGQSVLKSKYNQLFNVIFNTYGSVDDNHFNVPDLRGKTLVGVDTTDTDFNSLGKNGGEKTHKLTVNEMPKHTHGEAINSSGGARYPYTISGGGGTTKAGNWISGANTMLSYTGAQNLTDSTGGDGEHNNLQPYSTVIFIIKAYNSIANTIVEDSLPIGSVVEFNGSDIPEGWTEVADEQYSTEEQYTGKKWIDGKKIYRKIIYVSNANLTADAVYYVNNEILNLDIITLNQCLLQSDSASLILPSYRGTNDTYGIEAWYEIENKKNAILSHMTRSNVKVIITMEYTKTTD